MVHLSNDESDVIQEYLNNAFAYALGELVRDYTLDLELVGIKVVLSINMKTQEVIATKNGEEFTVYSGSNGTTQLTLISQNKHCEDKLKIAEAISTEGLDVFKEMIIKEVESRDKFHMKIVTSYTFEKPEEPVKEEQSVLNTLEERFMEYKDTLIDAIGYTTKNTEVSINITGVIKLIADSKARKFILTEDTREFNSSKAQNHILNYNVDTKLTTYSCNGVPIILEDLFCSITCSTEYRIAADKLIKTLDKCINTDPELLARLKEVAFITNEDNKVVSEKFNAYKKTTYE